MFTYNDLVGSYPSDDYDPNFSDLVFFTDDGSKITFKRVPAPVGWDGLTDWTDNEDYVMKALHGMTFDIEDLSGFTTELRFKLS